jgi:Ferric reductase like transmembrane component
MRILYLLIAGAGLTVAELKKDAGGANNKTSNATSTHAAASAPSSKGGGGGGANSLTLYYESFNIKFTTLNLEVLAGFIFCLFLWQTSIRVSNHLRRLITLNNGSQRYFTRGDSRFAWLKQHLIYAPLFRTRHHREFQLSHAINMGILPSRLHTIFLMGMVALNIYFCLGAIPLSQSMSILAPILRNRVGAVATVNLVPLVILATRNNPLIPLLRVSFDTWNFFHRWLARIIVLEAFAHMIFWLISKVESRRCSSTKQRLGHTGLTLLQKAGP